MSCDFRSCNKCCLLHKMDKCDAILLTKNKLKRDKLIIGACTLLTHLKTKPNFFKIKIFHADLLIDQTTFSLRLGAKERLNGLFLNEFTANEYLTNWLIKNTLDKTSQRKKEHLVGIVKRTGDCSELNCQDCALTFKTELNFNTGSIKDCFQKNRKLFGV